MRFRSLKDMAEKCGQSAADRARRVLEQPAPSQPKTRRAAKIKGEMTETEKNYERRLWALRLAGEIESYAYEADTLELAYKCTYTPDFTVMVDGRREFHEVKGPHQWEDSWIKFKVAARLFSGGTPQTRFVWAQLKDGQWRFKIFEHGKPIKISK